MNFTVNARNRLSLTIQNTIGITTISNALQKRFITFRSTDQTQIIVTKQHSGAIWIDKFCCISPSYINDHPKDK